MLANGNYVTEAGSTLEISGKYSGIVMVEFDWLEEGGCCDCVANAYPEFDGYAWYLTWHCDSCGSGQAKLRDTKLTADCFGQQTSH